MAAWGVDALSLDPLDRDQLVISYMRRKKWESELAAMEIVHWLDEALAGKAGRGGRRASGPRRISASQMLAETGKEAS